MTQSFFFSFCFVGMKSSKKVPRLNNNFFEVALFEGFDWIGE